MFKLVMVGYFLVMDVAQDYNGTYNILLEQKGSGHLVSTWSKTKPAFEENSYVYARVAATCNNDKVGEVLEGNGKIGSQWRAEDDWYLNRWTYICSAKQDQVEIDP